MTRAAPLTANEFTQAQLQRMRTLLATFGPTVNHPTNVATTSVPVHGFVLLLSQVDIPAAQRHFPADIDGIPIYVVIREVFLPRLADVDVLGGRVVLELPL